MACPAAACKGGHLGQQQLRAVGVAQANIRPSVQGGSKAVGMRPGREDKDARLRPLCNGRDKFKISPLAGVDSEHNEGRLELAHETLGLAIVRALSRREAIPRERRQQIG
jgi:hypothetical protein